MELDSNSEDGDAIMSESDDSKGEEENHDDETYKEKAYKFLDGSLSFHEYEAAIEAKDQDEELDATERRASVSDRKRRIKKTLPPALLGLMGQANICFAKGEYDSALQMCLEIIRQVPTAPEPFQTLAEIYEEKGMKEKSLQFAMIAAHLDPRNPEQWIHLGERSLQLNNLSEAFTCYSKAVKYDPSNINAHIIKAQLLEQKGDRKGAIKAYHKLIETVKPECGVQILEFAKIAAQYYHEVNEISKAKEVMELAFSKVPDLVELEDVNLYVELLMTLKDYIKALEIIAKYCDVKIEAEEDIVADNSTNQLMCSSFRIISCEIPPETPIQIHVKLIVVIIHLKSCHLLGTLLTPFLEVENVEQSGDLYIDVVEALMSEGMHIEALKLLKLLVESKNYSLPAVWLNYAECLRSLGKLEDAVNAYLMVMQQAPKHIEARLHVSELLNELGRSDEAISALTQDPELGSLDAGLLYERCLLLKENIDRSDEFLAVGRLLLSRHCVKITKRSELKPLSQLKGFARKQEAMRKISGASDVSEPELVEGKRLPTADEEWDLFLALCRTAFKSKQYALLQRLAFSALGSSVLNNTEKKEADVFFMAILACFFNKDSFHGYNLARDMILNDNYNPKAWNIFNVMLFDSDDARHHKFIMRQLTKKQTHPALTMLHANNCFITGTYKYALSEYMSAYRQEPSGMLAFMISATLLQMACQKFSDKKNSLLTQSIAFLWQYKEFRGEKNLQEVHYNMGRLFHQLGLLPIALFNYKKALEMKPPDMDTFGDLFDLKREIAFNISLIYQSTGCTHLARYYTEKYIIEKCEWFVDKMSNADSISFKTFCDLCADISKADRDKKSEILRNFIENWRNGLKTKSKCSFYPVLRLLLPQLDRERGAYGVKENTLAKIYIRILCLPKNGNDAIRLLEYRVPKSGNQSYDFAEVSYWILKTRCSKGEGLTVKDVNDHLDMIASCHATNDPRGVDSELITLLRGTSAEEQKWLIRIILKDLKFGLGQNKILYDYHPDARDFYDSCNDLKKICDVLTDPKIRLHEIGIQIFSPFRPMLSEECDVSKVDNYLRKSPYYYIETKLDGERFQVHMSHGDYKYFSRNGYEYTSNFGRNREEGVLTPRLAKQIRSDVDCVILDGEMMCWDSEARRLVSKGMNTDVKNLKENSHYKPYFYVFDILYLDGRVLTNSPLNHRLNVLTEIITPEEGVISFVDRRRISRQEEVWEALNEAIENREEGIVMKDFLSVYKPNVRKNGGWYKLKPEYTDGLMDSLDVLIVGGYYGSGRHKGNISHFLLGVAVESSEDDDPKKFYSVARVGSGYSMEELFELQMKLKPHWNKAVPGEMPQSIEWTKEKPDLWIEPSKSFILQVKASEIMPSDSFKTRHTLRFPRVEKVRYDKSWKECLTFEEFERKRKAASGKLVKRGFESSDTDESVSPKKKSNISVPSWYKQSDLSQVERRSILLTGKEICVFSGFDGSSKSDVERRIVEFGGNVVQNPGVNTYCVLAEEESNVKISNVIKCGSHNVVRTSWFISQLTEDARKIPQLTPEVVLGACKKTREEFRKVYDEYGDHFTEFASRQSLEHPFRIIETEVGTQTLTPEDMYDIDIELFSGPSPYGLFRCCTAYFDEFYVVGNIDSGRLDGMELSRIDFKFHGGICRECVDDATTHVIVSTNDLTRLDGLRRLNRRRRKKFYLVTECWVFSSVKYGKRKNEDEYYPEL